MWTAGYWPVDEGGRFLRADAPELRERGVLVAPVAGAARHHSEALAAEAAAPGSRLSLRRDPANEHDPHAVAVDLPGGGQLGWVPRELAPAVARALDAGEEWSAVVLRERRASPRDPRTGLTMALAPGELELRVVPR